jgi:hypothetical protein
MVSFAPMRRAVLALLLLATFALGLTAGAHPCQAAHGADQAQAERTSQLPSCHAGMAQRSHDAHDAKAPAVRKGAPSHGERDCCQIACQHACHLVAVVSFQPVTCPSELVAERLVTSVERGSSLFAGGIDHIPLL